MRILMLMRMRMWMWMWMLWVSVWVIKYKCEGNETDDAIVYIHRHIVRINTKKARRRKAGKKGRRTKDRLQICMVEGGGGG